MPPPSPLFSPCPCFFAELSRRQRSRPGSGGWVLLFFLCVCFVSFFVCFFLFFLLSAFCDFVPDFLERLSSALRGGWAPPHIKRGGNPWGRHANGRRAARTQAAGLGSARLLPACYTTSPAARACCQQSPCFPSQRGNPALFPPWWILFFSSGSWTRQQAPRGRAVPGACGVQSLALLSLRFLLLVRRASALPAPGAAFPAELRLRAFARPVYF